MSSNCIRRRAHTRCLPNGGKTRVRECLVTRGRSSRQKSGFRRKCPHCGTEIISVGMPNGGWGHFEGARGLERIKHACFNRGRYLSRKRDKDTADLFENLGVENMPKYKDLDRDSGVRRYEYGPDWIEVEFERGSIRTYRYTYLSAGSTHIEEMKRLADLGEGLNAYIQRNVAQQYASKR